MLEHYQPQALQPEGFNPSVDLPYGLHVGQVQAAMQDWLDFLAFINAQLYLKNMNRFEDLLMPATFSGLVGEFIVSSLPKYCPRLVKNRYPNGHPDLLPAGQFADDKAPYTHLGIEVKALRHQRGWQGHNPESVWLLVFVFETRHAKSRQALPFRFQQVLGAALEVSDWRFAGRSDQSRRTITASVSASGYQKMRRNWLYRA